MQEFISYYINAGWLEWFAVVTSLAYVVLAAYQNRLCWPAALLSTIAYSIVFYKYYLWSDSALQLYYLAMAIYGWFSWQAQNQKVESTTESKVLNDELSISVKSSKFHGSAIIILAVIALALGYVMDIFTPTDFPYLDAATTVFAVFSTYLVTQKVLENWLYWVVIDAVSIYVYVQKGLMPTAFLFGVFTVIAVFGYLKWLKEYSQTNAKVKYMKVSG